MARKGIREYDAKRLMKENVDLFEGALGDIRILLVREGDDLSSLPEKHPWLLEHPLVVKPDMLFGKRGKLGLVKVNTDWEGVLKYLEENMGREITVGKATDRLTHFLIERYIPHEKEFYTAILSEREGDIVYFSTRGGVDVEEMWKYVKKANMGLEGTPRQEAFQGLLEDLQGGEKELVMRFLKGLYELFVKLDFVYLEINPFALSDGKVYPLDTVARLDDTASFRNAELWGDIDFPAPFGRKLSPEEAFVEEIDRRSGASLKLTVLNPQGRIWTLVAGGGASIAYADTIVDLGFAEELANYGEYSGNPSEEETYLYARTVLDLMTREKDPQGREKILIIGGGIANFTDVAETFKGVIKALREYADKLMEVGVRVYVRRGGPNYEQGLKLMKETLEELGIPAEVYGPETNMTAIVRYALEGHKEVVK